MLLLDYMKRLSAVERQDLALRVGTTVNYLWKLCYNFERGFRPSAEIAAQIDIASNQMVRRWESIPESWHRIWPELIGVDGAPPIPPDAPGRPRLAGEPQSHVPPALSDTREAA